MSDIKVVDGYLIIPMTALPEVIYDKVGERLHTGATEIGPDWEGTDRGFRKYEGSHVGHRGIGIEYPDHLLEAHILSWAALMVEARDRRTAAAQQRVQRLRAQADKAEADLAKVVAS